MLHGREREVHAEQPGVAEQMERNMEIMKRIQEKILESFAQPQRDELRLSDAELKGAFRRANKFSGPVQRSFMISNPPPRFEDMLSSFIAQDIICKVEKVHTPAELSEEGRRQLLELSKKIGEGLRGVVNVTEKEFRIDGEPLGEPTDTSKGSLRWTTRSYTIDFGAVNRDKPFRVYRMSESDTYLRGREGLYNAEGRLVRFSDNYKTYIPIEPGQKLLLRLPDHIRKGLRALGMVNENKRTLDADELQKIHRKLADDKTKKLKLKELSELPGISDDVIAATTFVNSAVKMLKDIERAKRLEADILELSSNWEVQLCRKEYEKRT